MGKENLIVTDKWFKMWIKTKWLKIIAKYSPQDFYNVVETGFYFCAMFEHSYLFKNETVKAIKSSKEQVIVFRYVNIIGEKREQFVIKKHQNDLYIFESTSLIQPFDFSQV